jgi:hypothetical protein
MVIKNALFRVAIWASAGFLITRAWGFYFQIRDRAVPIRPIETVLEWVTLPGAALDDGPHGLIRSMYENAIAYALVGLTVEAIRQYYRRRQTSN